MGFYTTTSVTEKPHPETPSCAQKTASGKFFTYPIKTQHKNRHNSLKTNQKKPLFTHETASGVFYYKFRHYSAELGRWPGRDPIEERGGVNVYGFVGNDGINQWDMLGLEDVVWPEKPCEKASPEEWKKFNDSFKSIWESLKKKYGGKDLKLPHIWDGSKTTTSNSGPRIVIPYKPGFNPRPTTIITPNAPDIPSSIPVPTPGTRSPHYAPAPSRLKGFGKRTGNSVFDVVIDHLGHVSQIQGWHGANFGKNLSLWTKGKCKEMMLKRGYDKGCCYVRIIARNGATGVNALQAIQLRLKPGDCPKVKTRGSLSHNGFGRDIHVNLDHSSVHYGADTITR